MSLRETLGLSFHLLRDADNLVAESYGLAVDTPAAVREVEERLGLNLPEHNGNADWRLPMPATVIIGADGTVRYAAAQADHAERPEPEDTLRFLREALRADSAG